FCFVSLMPPQLTSSALRMKSVELIPICQIRVYGISRLRCILEIAIMYDSARHSTEHRLYTLRNCALDGRGASSICGAPSKSAQPFKNSTCFPSALEMCQLAASQEMYNFFIALYWRRNRSTILIISLVFLCSE